MEALYRQFNRMGDRLAQKELHACLDGVYARMSNQIISGSPGLVQKADNSAVCKAGSAFVAVVNGKLVAKAADTDMAALSGTITAAGYYNVYCFFMDDAGTLTTLMGKESTTLANVKFPLIPNNKVMVGGVLIKSAAANAFVGGDGTNGQLEITDAGTDPAEIYFLNGCGMVDPTAILN